MFDNLIGVCPLLLLALLGSVPYCFLDERLDRVSKCFELNYEVITKNLYDYRAGMNPDPHTKSGNIVTLTFITEVCHLSVNRMQNLFSGKTSMPHWW